MEQLEGATTVERMILDQAKRTRTPANGSIELLPLCNMNCDMCYVRLSREEMERQGRLRTADEWLEIGRQMKDAGVLFLLLTGGEPFLYPDFRKLYLGFRDMGMILTINTNGTADKYFARLSVFHGPPENMENNNRHNQLLVAYKCLSDYCEMDRLSELRHVRRSFAKAGSDRVDACKRDTGANGLPSLRSRKNLRALFLDEPLRILPQIPPRFPAIVRTIRLAAE